jgi:hypothetical protein
MTIFHAYRNVLGAAVLSFSFVAGNAFAETPKPVPVQAPSMVEDIRAALFGGVPGDKWKEGLLFEGIKPMPWMKSAANWFPRTEEIQPNEMRIIFMGSAPFIRPGQMNTSIFVQLGNGEILSLILGRDRRPTTSPVVLR